jgi:putative transposase
VSTAVVVRAYRFALDPTPAQARDLQRHTGAARFAFNWALAAVKANIDQRRAERSYGLTGDQLTPALGSNLAALRRKWKPDQGPGRTVVAGVLEGGGQHRPGRGGPRVG